MVRMSAFGLCLTTCLASPLAAASNGNPLIGRWVLTGGTAFPNEPGIKCIVTEIEFAAKTQTTLSYAGANTIDVYYVPYGKKYAVSADPGLLHYTVYDILGPDQLQEDDYLGCTYRRLGATEQPPASQDLVNGQATGAAPPPPVQSFDDAIKEIDESTGK